MTSSFAPYVIINTARQKTSHHDGNITGNQQISPHNDETSQHNKTTPHNTCNIATVHYDKTPKHQDNTSRPKE